MRISRQMLGMAAASVFGLAAVASAQDIEFHGAVFGCFDTGSGCTVVPPLNAQDTQIGGSLKYNGTTFDNTTAFGAAGFGSDITKPSFGHMSVAGDYHAVAGEKLDLEFFFSPAFVGGTPTVTSPFLYDAFITGTVIASPTSGDLFIDFGSPVSFAFTNGGTTADGFTHSGIATLTVNDLDLTPGATNSIVSGRITTRITDTPEPATVALFATGLVGLIPVARRRAKNRA